MEEKEKRLLEEAKKKRLLGETKDKQKMQMVLQKHKMSLQEQQEIAKLNLKKDIEEKRRSNEMEIKIQDLIIEQEKITAGATRSQEGLHANRGTRFQKSYHSSIKVPIFKPESDELEL